MQRGLKVESMEVQKLIARHYDGLRAFYEPNREIYGGLAKAYVDDPRFKANYENIAEGLAKYLSDAMMHHISNSLKGN